LLYSAVHCSFFLHFFYIYLEGKNFFLYLYQQNETIMKIQDITDNRLRNEMIQLSQGLQKHTFARMAMMMLEEKGIYISYEDALNL